MAKVHKKDVTLGPTVSMPGLTHHGLTAELEIYIKKLPDATINTKDQKIQERLATLKLEDDESLVSKNVVSLFNKVPLKEAITLAGKMLLK